MSSYIVIVTYHMYFICEAGICNAWLGPISETDKLNIIGLVDLNEDAAKAVQEKYD